MVQKGDFIEAREQDLWAGRAVPGTMRRDWFYNMELGGGKVQGKFPVRFSYAKTPRILEA